MAAPSKFSPVWEYKSHRISLCDEIIILQTGCSGWSVCIPPGFSMLQIRATDIASIPQVLKYLEEKIGAQGIHVVLGSSVALGASPTAIAATFGPKMPAGATGPQFPKS